MNVRIDREGVRFRLSADEARRLLERGEIFETHAALRFGVRLADGPPALEGLVANVPREDWQAALTRVGAKDAGVYSPGLAVEIDAFTR